METKGLLAGDAPETPPADDVLRRQLLFWGRHLSVTHSAHSADSVQRRLATSRIVLVATGLFGAATYDILARSGCEAFSVMTWDDDGIMERAVAESPVVPQQFVHPATASV